MRPQLLWMLSVAALCTFCTRCPAQPTEGLLRAGAAAVDITPPAYPVLINGGMTSNSATAATTPIHARALALQSGSERLAIVVVDSCMMSRPFLDEVKSLAQQRTGLPRDRMLISATHAHSVPAAMGCLGTEADEAYVPYLRIKIVEAIETAIARLEPARIGWASGQAANYTAVRRWIRRPDRVAEDPFGNKTVRANMHAGRVWDDVTGESGPEDPELALISVQSIDGRPLAVLANFSMHYFSGEKPVSADYFGRFCEGLQARVSKSTAASQSTASQSDKDHPAFVALMSHGCSGDIWRMDYTKKTPAHFETIKIEEYTQGLLDIAEQALTEVQYASQVPMAMAEARVKLKYRVPDKQRLAWAQGVVEKMGPRVPKTTEEVYAREQLFLHERQETEVVVQAIRIGSIAIATTPTETYALTGMKLKKQSPLNQTMVIELAGGGDGYIPPPEQHVLGGYNTWPARSAGLEIDAEPKIAEAAVGLLEQVCGQSRRSQALSRGPETVRWMSSHPKAYYRLNDMEGPRARDDSGHQLDGIFEPGVVFFLEGPRSSQYCLKNETNRAAHFAGGRLRTSMPGLGNDYSIAMWIWNGMPADGREIAGWFYGRGRNHALDYTPSAGEAVGIAGRGEHAGKLIFQCGQSPAVHGKTIIPRWTWAHVRIVRRDDRCQVFLDRLDEDDHGASSQVAEIDTQATWPLPVDASEIFFGGRSRPDFSWEGRLDEIVVHSPATSER